MCLSDPIANKNQNTTDTIDINMQVIWYYLQDLKEKIKCQNNAKLFESINVVTNIII